MFIKLWKHWLSQHNLRMLPAAALSCASRSSLRLSFAEQMGLGDDHGGGMDVLNASES